MKDAKLIIWCRSLLFNLLFYIWTAIASTILLPSILINWKVIIKAQKIWSYGVLLLARYVAGIRYELRGMENVPEGPVIIAAKHHSAWETIALTCVFPRPAYVLKRELMRIPVFGWYGGPGGHIPVDREAGASAMRLMLRAADKAKVNARQILIFPEGNRKAIGAPLDYKPGVIGLYRHLGLPVVPAGLNSGLYWGRNAFLKKPGTIIVDFQPPIPPGLNKREFMTRLQDSIEASTQALIEEGKEG